VAWEELGRRGVGAVNEEAWLVALISLGALLFLVGGLGLATRKVSVARLAEAASGVGIVFGLYLMYSALTLEELGRIATPAGVVLSLIVLIVFSFVWYANRGARRSLEMGGGRQTG
jgi:hypothetical protein